MVESLYPRLARFAQGNYSTVKSYKCGQRYIPTKYKCWTDPTTGRKLKKPLNYKQYSRSRAIAWKKGQSGKPLDQKEKSLVSSVARQQNRIEKKKITKRYEAAAKSIGVRRVSSTGISETNPHAIAVDPKRFQYKIKSDGKTGSVGSLKGVQKYDPNLGGIIQVWHDKKQGKTFVVNGHNRLDLAKRANAPSVTIRFLDVKSPKEARAVGALTNIAEGRGTAQDAAKFFRDSGLTRADLEAKGIPMREAIATNGLALANLSDELFDQVVQGKIPEGRAVVIGGKLSDKSQQRALLELVKKEEKRGRKITNDVLVELAEMVRTAPKQQAQSSGQLSLLDALGFDPEEKTLAIEKAQVTASIKRKMVRDRKLFSTVGKSKAAQDLSEAGNKINVDRSKEIAAEANTTLQLFDKAKRYRGKVDNALNEGAQRIANGENKEKVIKDTYRQISEDLQKTYKFGKESRAGRNNSRNDRRNSKTAKLQRQRSAQLATFTREYPHLAKFAKEKGWHCGNSYISVRAKCYTNPKTGKKLGSKYVINPKTGRRNKVRIGLNYREYQKARTKAIKKKGGGGKLNQFEQRLIEDTKKLATRTRKKKQRSLDAKNKRIAKKNANQLPKQTVKNNEQIAYKILDKTVKDWDGNVKLKVFIPSLLNRSEKEPIEDVGGEVVKALKKSGLSPTVTENKKRKANPEFLRATDAIADEVFKNQEKFAQPKTQNTDKVTSQKKKVTTVGNRKLVEQLPSDYFKKGKQLQPIGKIEEVYELKNGKKQFKVNGNYYDEKIVSNLGTNKPYSNARAKTLITRDYSKRTEKQLVDDKYQVGHYISRINKASSGNKAERGSLTRAGYYKTVTAGTTPVIQPKDPWIRQNLQTTKTKIEEEMIRRDGGKSKEKPSSRSKEDSGKELPNQVTLENYKTYRKRLNSGDITATETKAYYEVYKRDRDTVLKQELSGLTKAKLAPMAGYLPKSEKKSILVRGALDQMDFGFVLGGGLSHGFAEGDREKALDKKVEEITDDAIQERANKIKARRAKLDKSLKNPETVEEFQTFVRYRGENKLSAEQAIKYDDLIAKRDRGNRKSEEDKIKQQKSVAKPVDLPSNKTFELKKTVHAKKGIDLYVATLTERVDKDKFYQLKSRAKTLGGYYSRYNRDGAIPGFQFEDEKSARSFMGLEEVAAPLINQGAKSGTKSDPAKKLVDLADRIENRANEKLNADRKVNTARRANIASGIESDARENIRHAQTIRNIAIGIENGEVQFLDKVSAATQVSQLEDGLIAAKHESARRKSTKIDGSSDFKKRERESRSPITDEDISFAKYPYPSIHKRHLSTLAEQAKQTPGLKLIGNKLSKDARLIANNPNKNRVTYSSDREIDNLRKVAKKVKKVDFSTEIALDSVKTPLQDYDRLQKMGIKSAEEYRAALREYNRFRARKGSADPIKQKERDLIGIKIDGYFPTPKPVVEKMIDLADLKKGQRVLEPSAGKGDIASAIKSEVGNDSLETIEIDYRLSDLLKAKGFNTRQDDFLDQKEGSYDRIIMNPPFEKGGDMKHVRHAYSLLAPGGKIVAITSESPFFNQKKEAQEFRQWLESIDGYSEKLPANSFKNSDRSTGVNTRLVVIEKPYADKYMQPLTSFSRQYPHLAQFAKRKIRVNTKVGSDRYYGEVGVEPGFYTRTRKGRVERVKKKRRKPNVVSRNLRKAVVENRKRNPKRKKKKNNKPKPFNSDIRRYINNSRTW